MNRQTIVGKTMMKVALCIWLAPLVLEANTPVKAAASHAAAAKPAPGAQAVLDLLAAGNQRFVAGKRTFPSQNALRRIDLDKNGQHPVVTVLTCSDSRVPPEHLFDAGLGDLFIIRVAGNVADTDEIGSIEYGVEHLGTPVLMVLGHSKCGAVTAVMKGDELGGSIPQLVDNIIPVAKAVKAQAGSDFSDASLDLAIKENVQQSVRDIRSHSAIVRELEESGKLRIVGAIYHLDTGAVEMLPLDSLSEPLVAQSKTTGSHAKEAAIVPIDNSPAQNNSVAIACALAILLAFGCWLLLFAERTRIRRINFRPRLLVGVLMYLVLILAPLVVYMAVTDNNRTLNFWFVLSSTVAILILLMVSLNTLSKRLGRIFHGLRQTIIQYADLAGQ